MNRRDFFRRAAAGMAMGTAAGAAAAAERSQGGGNSAATSRPATFKALRVYKEVGCDGMLMPDHVPSIAGDAGHAQAFAFTFGYIKALIAAVSA